MAEDYRENLKGKMDELVCLIYKSTKEFPKEELYGITSQLRRASVSIVLNYVEGFARRKKLVQLNFLEISYGSLKEVKYLLYFSFKEEYIKEENYNRAINLAEEIGAMLWTEITNLDKIKIE